MTDPVPFVCGRRALLIAAGAVGVGTVAACSRGGGSSASAPGGGANLAKTSDIPVGGGKVFTDAGVVITQPASGTFKAFTDVCTHQGGIIDQVTDKVMMCPLHGSEFSITDGSVVQGPATVALPEKTVTVSGGEISVT